MAVPLWVGARVVNPFWVALQGRTTCLVRLLPP
jgi:hypothetical protein